MLNLHVKFVQAERQTDGCTDRQTDGQTDQQTDRQTDNGKTISSTLKKDRFKNMFGKGKSAGYQNIN